MKEKLTIGLIQAPLVWHSPEANRSYFEQKISVTAGVDLFILPEMFSTGFTMNPQHIAEEMFGETTMWMQKMSAENNCAITGSIVVRENNQLFNRLIFVDEEARIFTYDKRHLFTLAGEHLAYSAGSQKLIVAYKGWKICPLICYDLRFPGFSRNHEDYDLLIYVANWPEIRIGAWDVLLQARAVENMSYVAGVNRIGLDNNAMRYNGHSQVIDEMGKFVVAPTEDESVIVADLNKITLFKSREKFKFLHDKDDFTVV